MPKQKFLLVAGIIFGAFFVAIPLTGLLIGPTSGPDSTGLVDFTLLNNAGVLIESRGVRIYIDPYIIPAEYGNQPADAILITHPHGDHYEFASMNLLQKDTTVNVFPDNMTSEILIFDGVGIQPEEQITIGHITITAFYMYTLPVGEYPASHPQEANWTSYIVDVGGFTFFHAGDSKNITEYDQLNGMIDVALLPLGPGCQTMFELEVVDAINRIQPGYVIGIHYVPPTNDHFELLYAPMTDATFMNIDYFASCQFEC